MRKGGAQGTPIMKDKTQGILLAYIWGPNCSQDTHRPFLLVSCNIHGLMQQKETLNQVKTNNLNNKQINTQNITFSIGNVFRWRRGVVTILLRSSYVSGAYMPRVFCSHADVDGHVNDWINEKSVHCRESSHQAAKPNLENKSFKKFSTYLGSF